MSGSPEGQNAGGVSEGSLLGSGLGDGNPYEALDGVVAGSGCCYFDNGVPYFRDAIGPVGHREDESQALGRHTPDYSDVEESGTAYRTDGDRPAFYPDDSEGYEQ